ncbi:MAG TPA: bifunctional 4-hydroxy-2-oxoglutarate aldolase/2-dehydro-3-deoxy-phosphogluconate aldolase [Mycobacteriales bacterium]|nr:bifunctional 4-hydroxy-2-oxoglutarate aldolase/2-dehydro-3-deoxy-phosphogluconate aldolase [Mycobacteriales bacterium]
MSAIAEQHVIGIVRADNADAARETGRRLLDAGLRAVEISLTTPGALDVIDELSGPDVIVGAGTVLDASTARLAVLAGATFLVAPSFDPETVATGHRYGVAVIPGAQSPTEIVAAMSAGADAVKLYPASAASPAVLKDLAAPLPQVPFVPTGGVRLDDAADWIAAGAVAVGLGSALSKGTAAETTARVGILLDSLGAPR